MKSKRARACDISQKVKAAVWERDGGCCVICGRHDTAAPNAHYIRRSRGGLGIAENIVTLCAECHRRQDNGTGEQQRLYNAAIRAYLQGIYPGWDESKLVYSKWGG